MADAAIRADRDVGIDITIRAEHRARPDFGSGMNEILQWKSP
jgi:hypothetical protein